MNCNKTQLGKRLGVSCQAVSVLLRSPDAPAPVSPGLYDLAAVRAFWKSRKELNKAAPGGTYAEELKAKVAAQRALLELELETKRGRLIDADTVEMQQRAFVQVVTSGLLNAHTTLALLVADKPAPECEREIKAFMRRLLESWKKLARKDKPE